MASLLLNGKMRNHEEVSLVLEVYPVQVVDHDLAKRLPKYENHFTPISNRLYEFLRPLFKRILPEDAKYDDAFDRFEYLLGLVHADLNQRNGGEFWGPIGRFGWKNRRAGRGNSMAVVIEKEIDQAKADWPPLRAGFFDGSADRLRTIKAAFDAHVARVPWF